MNLPMVRRPAWAFAALLLGVPAGAAAQDWPTWRRDARRTGLQESPATVAAPAVTASFRIGGVFVPGDLVVADVDLDGVVEAVFARSGSAVAVRPNGTLAWSSAPAGAGRPLGIADLDGDGRPEVVFETSPAAGLVAVDGTTGGIAWGTSEGEIPALGTVLPIDVEGDGAEELYVADDGCSGDGRGAGRIYGFDRGLGAAYVRTTLRTETHDNWCGRWHVAADLDGDGAAELVAPDADRIWAYDPALGFSRYASDSLGDFPWGLVHAAPADLDGDGDDELVLASDNSSRWLSTARRLTVLDRAGEDLVAVWEVVVDPSAGRHSFLDSPAADVTAGSPGLEVVSSFRDSASSGWVVRVFAGLTAGGGADVLAEIPGRVAVALADLDGDGLAEIVAQEATGASAPGIAPIEVWRVSADGVPSSVWSAGAGSVPVAPRIWGGRSEPFLTAAGRVRRLVVARDADGDTVADGLDAVDGATGGVAASFVPPDGSALTAVLRPAGGTARLAAASDDGTLSCLDDALAVVDDPDRDGVADVRVGRVLAASVVVSGGMHATVDAGGRIVAFERDDSGEFARAWRSAERVDGGAAGRVSFSPAAGGGQSLVAGFRVSDGTLQLLSASTSGAWAVQHTPLGNQSDRVVWDPLVPAGAPGTGPAAIVGLYDAQDDRSHVVAAGFAAGSPSWSSLDEAGSITGPLSAIVLPGGGPTDLFVPRAGMIQRADPDGVETARAAAGPGGAIAAADVDADGTTDLIRTGARDGGPERFGLALDRVWVAADGVSHRDVFGALAPASAGGWLVGAVAASSSMLAAYGAADGAVAWSVVPAGGSVFPSVEAAEAAGATPGTLSSVSAATDLTGRGHASFVVGSTDHYLYALSADDGSLDWAVPLHAAVGEPAVADGIVVPTSDGVVHLIEEATLEAPAAVWDNDGASEATGDDDEIDESGDAAVVGANWPAVDGAEGYLVLVATEDDVVVRWPERVVRTSFVARDVVLQPGVRYRTVVRATGSGGAASPETASDGFEVIDAAAPEIALSAEPIAVRPGAGGTDDVSVIRASLRDAVALRRYAIRITDPSGATVRDLASAELGGTSREVSASWNGRGDDGRVVPGGTYRVLASVQDDAGLSATASAEVWVCTGAAEGVGPCAAAPGDAGTDAGAPDVPGDGGTLPAGGGGCSCRAAGTGGAGVLATLGAALALALAARRRGGRHRRSRAPRRGTDADRSAGRAPPTWGDVMPARPPTAGGNQIDLL